MPIVGGLILFVLGIAMVEYFVNAHATAIKVFFLLVVLALVIVAVVILFMKAFAARQGYGEAEGRRQAAVENQRAEEARLAREQEARTKKAKALERATEEKLREFFRDVPTQGLFRVPYMDLNEHPGLLVHQLVEPYLTSDLSEIDPGTAHQIAANTIEVSRDEYSDKDIENGQRLWPNEYPGRDAAHRYLKNTKFSNVFDTTLAVDLPGSVRPEHGIIIGKTGAGKSQLLEKLILADLQQDDPPGMLIIDSKADKGSLFNRIPRLDVFHPDDGRLRDRLILIDPVNDQPALNMFDVPGELTNAKVNEINNSMRYFFGGLLGDDLSAQMNTLFLPLLHVILRVPGATLHDLQKLVRDPLQYPDILDEIPRGIRRFLVEEFSAKNDGYRATKQSLVTRIQGIINEVTLDEMFSAPKNAIDVSEALNNGAIILVSTNAAALQHVSPIFGRYWISQMLNAGMTRTTDRPIHFYSDETAPYVDDKLVSLLTTIRSYNVGLMLAFQGVWQMGSFARAILSNTDIKFVSGLDESDAKTFEPFYKGMDAEQIMAVQKEGSTGRFALQHRELKRAVTVEFPFGELDREPQMSAQDYQRLRKLNRQRLQAAPRQPPTAPEPEPPDVPQSKPRKPHLDLITNPSPEPPDDLSPSTIY